MILIRDFLQNYSEFAAYFWEVLISELGMCTTNLKIMQKIGNSLK